MMRDSFDQVAVKKGNMVFKMVNKTTGVVTQVINYPVTKRVLCCLA